jgi:hypothetical protein
MMPIVDRPCLQSWLSVALSSRWSGVGRGKIKHVTEVPQTYLFLSCLLTEAGTEGILVQRLPLE